MMLPAPGRGSNGVTYAAVSFITSRDVLASLLMAPLAEIIPIDVRSESTIERRLQRYAEPILALRSQKETALSWKSDQVLAR
jgi:hypothetical protein